MPEKQGDQETIWRIRLLGGLSVVRGEQVINRFRTQKTALLLAYLAYHSSRSHPREALMELLWPEHRLEGARASLSMALSSLRQQLEPAEFGFWIPDHGVSDGPDPPLNTQKPKPNVPRVILSRRGFVQLDPVLVSTDVAEFQSALQAAECAADGAERARCLARAVEMYRGELLPGYHEGWILQERQWLAEEYFKALGHLLRLLEREGELEQSIQYAQDGVRADPLREEAHSNLMRLYAAAGQADAALHQYHELERLLREELGTAPSPGTAELAGSLETGTGRRGDRPSAAEPPWAPGLRAGRDRTSVLPVASSPHRPIAPTDALPPAAPVGGVVPLDSPFYVARPTDCEFKTAIQRRDSIVLVKGARQMGKTSLLARGLEQARQDGNCVVLTDFQTLDAAELESTERLFLALAERIADQLDLEVLPEEVWKPYLGPSANFERYLVREVLSRISAPLVWGLDEVDCLFPYDYSSQVFGQFRSWHNRRGLEPTGPWPRLTLAMACATEAHLFIKDLNQSPFNVGTRVTLQDFTRVQVSDLNRRCGMPLRDEAELTRFYHLVHGHPYLVSCGLHEMAARDLTLEGLVEQVNRDEGIYSDHLRRILVLLIQNPDLCEAVRAVLQGRSCPTEESFYRLRSAGVLVGDSSYEARPRCRLYETYLGSRIRE